MLKKTKIQKIAVVLLVLVLIGALFYFRIYVTRKKEQLDLTRINKQEVVQDDVVNQDAVTDDEGKADDLPEDKSADNQPDKISKNSVNTDALPISKTTKLSITDRLVFWGFQKSSGRKIDTIIIHSSYDAVGNDPYSVSGVIEEYRSYGVSPHYLIDRAGKIYRLVFDQNIAYHAGESKMPDGRTGVNNFSIGIEVLTTLKDAPTNAQYSALKLLIADLKGKYKITNILGHGQIAPGRKGDPWNFDWSKLK
ncbi:MAG: N-acetylmuramoyl-L-alanine amidase [Candidatus Moranbacteria bacterium]|nr:N-acetylmuramoyl-L-alanine amidase [Candidatus Moranbacteria bacterium]